MGVRAAMLGLSFYHGGYLSEVMRPAYLAVDRGQHDAADSLGYTFRQKMMGVVGPHKGSKPRDILIVNELPKTRSGKIMRRLLKDVAEHRQVGDVTTLADSSVMSLIQQGLAGR